MGDPPAAEHARAAARDSAQELPAPPRQPGTEAAPATRRGRGNKVTELSQLRTENERLRLRLDETGQGWQQEANARTAAQHTLQSVVDAQQGLMRQLEVERQTAAFWQAKAAELRRQLEEAQDRVAQVERELELGRH